MKRDHLNEKNKQSRIFSADYSLGLCKLSRLFCFALIVIKRLTINFQNIYQIAITMFFSLLFV